MIHIHTTSRYTVSKKLHTAQSQSYLEKQGVGDFLVNIVFVGKRKMLDIANTYKHENVALPVLAFPFKDVPSEGSDSPLLGEVFLCYPQVVLLAAEKEKSVDAMVQQLIEHGIRNLLK